MKNFEQPDLLIAVLYAVAAISGGLGGCAAASHYLTHTRYHRLPFIIAYILLGIVFGVVTFAVMLVYGYDPQNIHYVVLWSLVGGSAGSIALASANFTARLIFQKLGIELQVTVRKPDQERRTVNADQEL